MPPVKSNLKLNEDEIDLIRKWIDQGARYKKHWAFIPPNQHALPEVDKKDWVRNEIDRFVLARMEYAGVRPNEEADPSRLLKRAANVWLIGRK